MIAVSRTSMRALRLAGAVAVVALLLTACVFDRDEDEAPVQMDVTVQAFDFYFEPATLILEPEADVTVNFENLGDNTHSFTVPDLDVEVEAASGEDATIRFDAPLEPGPYEFFCKFHPNEMTGTISVEGDADEVDEDDDVDVDTEVEQDGDETDAGTDTDTETDADTGTDTETDAGG